MPSNFRHVVVTRLNVKVDYARAAQVIDPVWLRGRLEQFFRFAVPSIEGQRGGQPATWLVLCDESTPDWMRERLAERPLITPVWVTGQLVRPTVREAVADLDLADRDTLITTRLDSDDALARDHLARVQALHDDQPREFIDHVSGLRYFDGRLYRCKWKHNPFASLIEKVTDGPVPFTTVHDGSHTKLGDSGPVRRIDGDPMWLQSVHGLNNETHLVGLPRLRHSRRDGRFDVDWQPSTLGPARTARIAARAVRETWR